MWVYIEIVNNYNKKYNMKITNSFKNNTLVIAAITTTIAGIAYISKVSEVYATDSPYLIMNIYSGIIHENPARTGGSNSGNGNIKLNSTAYAINNTILGTITVKSDNGQCLIDGVPEKVFSLPSIPTTSTTFDFIYSAIDDTADEPSQNCSISATVSSSNVPEVNGAVESVGNPTITDDDKTPILTEKSKWPTSTISENQPTKDAHILKVYSNSGAYVTANTDIIFETNGNCSLYQWDIGDKATGNVVLLKSIGNTFTKTIAANKYLSMNESFAIAAADNSIKDGNRTCTATVRVSSGDPRLAGFSFPVRTATIIDDEAQATPTTSNQSTANTTPTTTQDPESSDAETAQESESMQTEIPTEDQLKTESFVEKIHLNGVPSNEAKNVVIDEDQEIVLTGVAIPNAKIKIYIFSEIRTAEVTADAEGAWTYTIMPLEAGSHRVELEVTKSDGTVGKRALVAAFVVGSVTNPGSAVVTQLGDRNSSGYSTSLIIVLTGLSLIIIAVAATLSIPVLRRKAIRILKTSRLFDKSSKA